MGLEPERAEMEWEEDEDKPLQPWEEEMMEKIERAEARFAKLNRIMSESMGQVLLLSQGLYAARGKPLPREEAPESDKSRKKTKKAKS